LAVVQQLVGVAQRRLVHLLLQRLRVVASAQQLSFVVAQQLTVAVVQQLAVVARRRLVH